MSTVGCRIWIVWLATIVALFAGLGCGSDDTVASAQGTGAAGTDGGVSGDEGGGGAASGGASLCSSGMVCGPSQECCDSGQLCLDDQCTPPPEIEAVSFDWDSHIRLAPGSDLWPVTWAADDSLYVSYGDGAGFGATLAQSQDPASGRVSIGFSRLEGDPTDLVAANVWGGKDAENPVEAPFDCQSCGKCSKMLAVGDTLYAFIDATLYRSTDNGAHWEHGGLTFAEDVSFSPNAFLNFGRGHEGAIDDYVYLYGVDYIVGDVSTYDDVYLARVPTDSVGDLGSYQYFAGLTASSQPTWTGEAQDKQPVLTVTAEPAEIGALAVVHVPGIHRYLLTGHNQDFMGRWSMYDAQHPWGPWKLVKQYKDWGGHGSVHAGMPHSFPAKWISDDGTSLWMTFSGTEEWDSFNLIEMKLSLAGEGETEEPITDMRAHQPTNLAVSSSDHEVTLSWDWFDEAAVDGFKVYRSLTGHEPWVRPTGGKLHDPTARTFVDDQDDLQPGTRYHYLVQAFKEPPGHNSLLSQQRQIIVGTGVPTDVVPTPTNVQASYDGDTITVSWDYDPQGHPITGFKLERQYDFDAWARPLDGKLADPSARSYSDEAALPDGIYVYRVFAYHGGDNYAFSENAVVRVGEP